MRNALRGTRAEVLEDGASSSPSNRRVGPRPRELRCGVDAELERGRGLTYFEEVVRIARGLIRSDPRECAEGEALIEGPNHTVGKGVIGDWLIGTFDWKHRVMDVLPRVAAALGREGALTLRGATVREARSNGARRRGQGR